MERTPVDNVIVIFRLDSPRLVWTVEVPLKHLNSSPPNVIYIDIFDAAQTSGLAYPHFHIYAYIYANIVATN